MGVTKVTQEMTVAVPPAALFKGHVLDSSTVIPKALPQFIESLELVEGNWGEPGSITKTTLQGAGFVKFKIDFVDKENLVFKHTMIEGDVLGDKIEYVSYESSFEPSGSGCLAKLTTEYHTKGDLELTEDEINDGKNRMDLQFKIVADYIAASSSLMS